MNAASYRFDISQATDTGTLLAYLADITSDAALTSEEIRLLRMAIADRFEALSVTRVENNFPQGRWSSPPATFNLQPATALDPFAQNPS